jgi:hypothetical protein
MKANLIKRSAQIHHHVREKGNVAWILEQYVNPKRPNLTVLWVVNGTQEFNLRRDALSYATRLSDQLGGDGQATMKSYDTELKSYTEQAYRAAIIDDGHPRK